MRKKVIVIIMATCRVTGEVSATPLAICMAMGKRATNNTVAFAMREAAEGAATLRLCELSGRSAHGAGRCVATAVLTSNAGGSCVLHVVSKQHQHLVYLFNTAATTG